MVKRKRGETSYKETAFGIIPRSQLIPLEIEGVKRAWTFILQRRARGRITITPSFIRELHAIGFGWIFPKMGGRFRAVEVRVSHHTPPKFYEVPSLMLNFTRDLKERMNHMPSLEDEHFFRSLIEVLAWAHHRFLWIHPFHDYNGRIARLLSNVIVLNLDLPPIELSVETKAGRKKYINALQAADGGNYRLLERIFEIALNEAARALNTHQV